ncbi:hypothetical protein AGMMS49965_10870 [Bacteroidia bacterium]|nr:hypothetical protein AGMMS49965_10870 [Bacteroidia bacterium]
MSIAPMTLVAQSDKGRSGVIVGEVPPPELNVTDNVVHVRHAIVGSKLEIFTIVGNRVRLIEMKTTDEFYPLNLPKGIYIFKLENTVRKFIIR